ncbi:hypothetical protein RRF57_007002 [Xylaria bambusicola]|uniref:Uncharacterized protein n=1 Tax=Xylaria bambusicola TaxID=326684 RepID=A0AAN7UK93_9PEZI
MRSSSSMLGVMVKEELCGSWWEEGYDASRSREACNNGADGGREWSGKCAAARKLTVGRKDSTTQVSPRDKTPGLRNGKDERSSGQRSVAGEIRWM